MNQVTKELIAILMALTFSVFLIASSFGQDYPSAFQFPLLIGILCLVPVALQIFQIVPKLKEVSFKISITKYKHFLALLYIIISIQIYEIIGFYLTGLIVFFTISLTYRVPKKNENSDDKKLEKPQIVELLKIAGISLVFIFVIYLLFAVLLKVQTPQGLFI